MMSLKFKAYDWLEIKDYLFQKLPIEYTTLTSLLPDEQGDNPLYLANYSYGDNIYQQGQWHYPKDYVVYTEEKPTGLQYSPLPLGLVLNHGVEQFTQHGNRIIPLTILKTGQWIGLTETLQSLELARKKAIPNNISITLPPYQPPSYNLSAGARSLFLLPPLQNQLHLKRLAQHHELNATWKLANVSEQHSLFRQLYRKCSSSRRWTCQILWFDESWVTHPAFQNYLYTQAFKQQQHRSLIDNEFLFQTLYRYRALSPYLVMTFTHLYHMAQGLYPGFRPQADEQLAPIRAIQEMLMEGYPLPYLPTLIAPTSYLASCHQPIYYSCNAPTLPQTAPQNTPKRYVNWLRELAQLAQLVSSHQQNDRLPPITSFHTHADKLSFLQDSQLITEQDEAFLVDKQHFPSLPFCHHNYFFKGCFRIG